MLSCPMCKKMLQDRDRECTSCRTDLSLLVDYVKTLQGGLHQAEALTRAGHLGEAVWTYLEVLEVDPDNAVARRQVGKVATAVRQFDRTAPGRRWLKQMQNRTRFRRWLSRWNEDGEGGGCLLSLMWILLVVGALFLGYFLGKQSVEAPASPTAANVGTQ